MQAGVRYNEGDVTKKLVTRIPVDRLLNHHFRGTVMQFSCCLLLLEQSCLLSSKLRIRTASEEKLCSCHPWRFSIPNWTKP